LVLNVLMHDILKFDGDAVVVGLYEDVRPLKGAAGRLDWLLCGALSRLVIARRVTGSLGDVALLTSKNKIPASKIFMVGLGPRSAVSPASIRAAARTFASAAAGAGVSRAGVDLFSRTNELNDDAVRAIREGILEGAGNASIEMSLLAPDPESGERISRVLNT